jgi:hypothetical protein
MCTFSKPGFCLEILSSPLPWLSNNNESRKKKTKDQAWMMREYRNARGESFRSEESLTLLERNR